MKALIGIVLEAFLKPDPLDNVTDGRMTLISSRLFHPLRGFRPCPMEPIQMELSTWLLSSGINCRDLFCDGLESNGTQKASLFKAAEVSSSR